MASGKATGNISPSRFIKLGSSEGTVTQCGSAEKMFGISQEGTRRAPYTGLDDGFNAVAGETVRVYEEGEICWLEAGGTIAVDDRLISDSDGKGTASTSDNAWIGAVALQSGVSGQLLKVRVLPPSRY